MEDRLKNYSLEKAFVELRQESEILVSLLDDLAEGVIIADKYGKFRFFNSAAEKILGIGSQEINPGEWSSLYGCYFPDKNTFFPSEDLPLSRVIQGSENCSEILFIRNPNKPEGLFIEVSASPIKKNDGSVIGGTAIFKDITARKAAEEKLKRSEEIRKAVFLGNPIPIFVWQKVDNDFELFDFNNSAVIMIGDNLSGLIGVKLSILYDSRPDIIDDFNKCFSEKSQIVREMKYEVNVTKKTLNLIVSYIFVEPNIIMVLTQDISEKEEYEKQMKLLSNAVEQTADSIVITNKKGMIEFVNPAFSEITGYNKEEVIGKSPNILKSGLHNIEFYKNIWDTILKGLPYRGTIINKRKDGRYFWSQQTITPMKDKDGNISHFVSVQKDITDLKKQQEIEFQMKVARELQERLYKNDIHIPGYDLVGGAYPALDTSGDYYDFFNLPDGSYALVVGDVTGHGLGPAMVMVETRSYLRAFALSESNPGKLLDLLNKALCIDLKLDYFVTMMIIRLDYKNNIIDYAGAGHELGYVFDKSGDVKFTMESMGIPLGYDPEYKYSSSLSIDIEHEDLILLHTDGIKESISIDGSRFGDVRLLNIIKDNINLNPGLLVKKIYEEVSIFAQGRIQEDDITMLICRRNPIE